MRRVFFPNRTGQPVLVDRPGKDARAIADEDAAYQREGFTIRRILIDPADHSLNYFKRARELSLWLQTAPGGRLTPVTLDGGGEPCIMCELLGLAFNQPIRPSMSFRGFRHGGADNPHGWGVARFEGRACQLFKEPITATRSRLASFLRDYEHFTGTLFIGHVRLRSAGEPSLANTHPFVRPFRRRDIAFAHNGTLARSRLPSVLKFHPVGDTDSEHLLCAFLTALSERQIALTDYAALEDVLRGFNAYGSMNILCSDGTHLFVYRDRGGYKDLRVVQRVAPFGTVSLLDEDWECNLAEEKRSDQRGVVIATRPLTNEDWFALPVGSLSVFKGGVAVYGLQT